MIPPAALVRLRAQALREANERCADELITRFRPTLERLGKTGVPLDPIECKLLAIAVTLMLADHAYRCAPMEETA